MKRTFAAVAVAAAVIIPATMAGSSVTSAAPADYRAECETAYQAGKPVFDPMIQNAKPVTGAVEKALCGENRHS